MVGLTIMVGPWRSTLIVRNTFCDDFPIMTRLEILFWFWIHPKLVETIHQHRTDDVRSCIGGAGSSSSGAIWWFSVILQYFDVILQYCISWYHSHPGLEEDHMNMLEQTWQYPEAAHIGTALWYQNKHWRILKEHIAVLYYNKQTNIGLYCKHWSIYCCFIL